MNKPWKYYDNRGDQSFDYSPGADGTFNVIDADLKVVAKTQTREAAALIVKCVNMHEELIAEIAHATRYLRESLMPSTIAENCEPEAQMLKGFEALLAKAEAGE